MTDKPIFINYRRTKARDKALILRWILEKEFGDGVSFLDEANIPSGEPWAKELERAVGKCHVLLALIHADWHKDQDGDSGDKCLNREHDWIRREIATALNAGKTVIPVLINQAYLNPSGADEQRTNPPINDWLPEDLHPLFQQQIYRLRFDDLTPQNLSEFLQHVRTHLPDPWNKPAQAERQEQVGYYPGVLQEVFPLPDELANAPPASPTPYVGLRPFRRDDARLFYGRSREIYELCFKLTHDSSRLLLLDGYSGTGKSSLLQAGLIPRIEAKGWRVLYARREEDKIGGLPGLLAGALAKLAGTNGPKLLILDQVEEVQTNPILTLPREIPNLLHGLSSALNDDPELKVILGFRSEFSAHLKRELEENFPDLRTCDMNNTIFSLERQGVIEAIRSVTADSRLNGVGKQFDLRFTPFRTLPETIADRLISSNLGYHIAPLLRVNMELLWQRCRRRDNGVVEISRTAVHDFIDTQEALLEHYLKKIRDQFSSAQVDDQRLLELLQYYVEEKPASAVRSDREFDQKFNSDSFAFGLREACKQLFLLYSQGSGDAAITRLTHDSLAAVIHGRYTRLTEQKVSSRGAALFKNLKEKIDAQINSLQYREALETLDEMMTVEEHRQELTPYLFELTFFWNEVQAKEAEPVLRHWLNSGLLTSDPQEQLMRLLAGRMDRDEVRHWLACMDSGRYSDMQTRYLAPPQTVMVPIEGGEFMMGDETGDLGADSVAHPARVSSFCMGNAPVTWWQYGLYLFAVGGEQEQTTSSQRSDYTGSFPACELDWYDAVSYCNWLSTQMGLAPAYSITKDQKDPSNESKSDDKKWTVQRLDGTNGFRLPTEAEWEYACRARTTTKYSFGDDEAELGEYAWYDDNSENRAHPVCLKKPNGFGLYDMHGNVWEWCQDWYGAYGKGQANDPIGAEKGSFRVRRGGGWSSNASRCRSAYPSRDSPDRRSYNLGVRLAFSSFQPAGGATETSR